ncbi:MAG TPA: urease accessory protein UreD [Phycisphaerae bacterium]|nr:urease accessory protein UreD [Phycisphaerae bacterium]
MIVENEQAVAMDKSGAHGQARLRFSVVEERTEVTEARATSPLRVLMPRMAGSRAAWAVTSSFGGGLLEGDDLRMEIAVDAGAIGYVGTQSATKVYRSARGGISRQTVKAEVGEGAVLAVMPDPVVCFRDARYAQRQRFDVAATGSLVLLDWFTSGRHGCGERWAFASLSSRNEMWMGGSRLVTDAVLLDGRAGAVAARMGGLQCYATLVLVGPAVEGAAEEMVREIGELSVRGEEGLRMAASGIRGGAIVRLAAENAERAAGALYRHLRFLGELLGEHPWLRKW